jgi:hypothetical protein
MTYELVSSGTRNNEVGYQVLVNGREIGLVVDKPLKGVARALFSEVRASAIRFSSKEAAAEYLVARRIKKLAKRGQQ